MKKPWKSRKLLLLTAFVSILVVVRLLLPEWVKSYVNRTLDSLEGYDGHVEDVDLYLWRGAYQIHGTEIVKTSGKVPVPFFSCPHIDLSLRWRALFQGSLVGEVVLREPTMNFVLAPNDAAEQTGLGSDWRETAQELFPTRIDRLEVVAGEVHLRNFHSDPKFDLYLQQVEATASNLTNSADLSESLSASVEVRAVAMEGAPLEVNVELDPLAPDPTFDLDMKLTELQLPTLNDFLKAYAHVDAEGGTFSLYAEFASSEGSFQGYAKPFFEDIQVFKWKEEEESNPFRLIWEAIAEGIGELLENDSNVATRIPYEGTFEDPDAGLWKAIVGLLRNAFVSALSRGIDHTIGVSAAEDGGEEKDD